MFNKKKKSKRIVISDKQMDGQKGKSSSGNSDEFGNDLDNENEEPIIIEDFADTTNQQEIIY